MKARIAPESHLFAAMLDYEPETGRLMWKPRTAGGSRLGTWNARYAGKEAGTIGTLGYRDIGLFGKLWKAHRVAWAIFYGQWPEEELDHVNGNRSDNRIVNLRPAARNENMQNIPLYKSNTSGFVGVHYNRLWEGWQARIGVENKRLNLGVFSTPEKAYQAYLAAKAKLHRYDTSGRVSCLG